MTAQTFCAEKKRGQAKRGHPKIEGKITGKKITTMPDIVGRWGTHPGSQDANGYQTAKEFIDMLAKK